LKPWWSTLGPLLQSGALKFIVSLSDGKSYLQCRARGNAQFIEISRQSPGMNELLRLCLSAEREGPSKRNVEEAIDELDSYAQVYGERTDTFYRVAPHPDGGIVIDIGNQDRTQVWIKPGCVQIIETDSNIPFCRTKHMLPLTMPADCGEVDRIYQYIPRDPPTALLIIAWITYTIAHPKEDASKYVILVLLGGEGSGKTSLSKRLQRLIDPTAMGVQTFPRNVQDLAVALRSSHLVIYDNIRTISPQMSDALCVSSTGGMLTGRKLYTDDGQATLNLHGPVILNGIHASIEQPDLAQRCLMVRLPQMAHGDRLPDDVLTAQFEADLPYIMRGLYDLIAEILKHLPTVKVTVPTRMMGFSRWIAAIEKVHGMRPGLYQSIYHDAVSEAQLDAVMDNPIGEALVALMARERCGSWTGTPTELLNDHEEFADRRVQRTRDWPNSPIALSKRLQALHTALAAQGISVQTSRGKTRLITIKKTGEEQ
jgi:hypothetical protein